MRISFDSPTKDSKGLYFGTAIRGYIKLRKKLNPIDQVEIIAEISKVLGTRMIPDGESHKQFHEFSVNTIQWKSVDTDKLYNTLILYKDSIAETVLNFTQLKQIDEAMFIRGGCLDRFTQ